MGIDKGCAIGGYHGLELPYYEGNIPQSLIRMNSGRSAIKLVLDSANAKKVWLPLYTCDAVVRAVKEMGLDFTFYEIDEDFKVKVDLNLNEHEIILLIDYFGLCSDTVEVSASQFGYNRVIVDCSQAFFSKPGKSLATVYSPRKFFGLPDGGLLFTKEARILQPEERDKTSSSRMEHLISRAVYSPEITYQQYLSAEKAISELPVQGMSDLTTRLLNAIDLDKVRSARSQNALYLHERLGDFNKLRFKLDETTSPLCYPFLPLVKTRSRADLIHDRVFLPSYWPEVLGRAEEGSFEYSLVNDCLFLPCDQRMNEYDMDRMVSLLGIK